MSTDLAQELGVQETAGLEFKRVAKDRHAVRKAICAFANDLPGLGGGDLVIGVDSQGNPTGGVDTSDETLLALTNIRDEGSILDRPSLVVSAETYRGERVIRIHVNASRTPPVRFDGVTYVRPGPSTRRASPDDERILSERRIAGTVPFDVSVVPGSTLEDLDLELFRSDYLRSSVDPTVLEENDRPVELQLASLRLTSVEGTPTGVGDAAGGHRPGELSARCLSAVCPV